MANKKISELPYINGGKLSGNTLVPLVTYFSAATGDTVHTYINDFQTYLISGLTGNTDVFVTGGTYSAGTITFTNNTGGTFNVTGVTFSGGSSVSGNYLPLSGGTVTGATSFLSGLTANTISATTYLNLPAGLTGQYLPLSGGTVTGSTQFTVGLSASTISATTYQNLPTDIRVTGGTYSAGTITFTNNTGGTFNVTGVTFSGGSSVSGNYLPLSGGTVTGQTFFTSGVTITGDTFINDTTGMIVIDTSDRYLYDSGGIISLDWSSRLVIDNNEGTSIDWQNRQLKDVNVRDSIDWDKRYLVKSDSERIFDWENGILTGQTNIQSSTISATTYLNLPVSLTGKYLPLSGGTVTGATSFLSGLTANTIYTNYIDFNKTATTSHVEGRVHWNDTFKSLEIDTENANVQVKVGHDMVLRVNNQTDSTLLKGSAVFINGQQGQRPTVTLGSYTGDSTSAGIIGLVMADIGTSNNGYVITEGILDGVDTSAYSAGTPLYLFTGGTLTSTKPLAPDHDVRIGKVINSSASGSIYVRVQNGWELDELHDVRISAAATGDLLVRSLYNAGKYIDNPVWVNTKTLPGSYTITGNTTIGGNLTATTISATTYQNLPTDVRVTGASYSNNTFTYTNNTGGTFNVLFNTLTGLTVNGNLTVTGNTNVRAFTGTTGYISGSGQNILTVIGSGNSTTSPLFSVRGSSGELFSVTDSLVGSLFRVNDISGLPIMEVFSNNTTLWGSYQAPSLNTTTRTSLTAGTNTIYSIPTSAYTGAFYEYTLISTGTTGARAGQIMSIWSGSTAQFTETSTLDIGLTTGVTFTVAVSGNNAVLSSSATTAGWTVKTIIRSI